MTVGVPEINLDTWGLKYVKKKTATENIEGGTERGERRGGAHSNFESGKPSKNITSPNTISDADIETPSAIETRQETADEGTRRTTGATEGSDKKRQQIGIKDTTIGTGKEVPVGSDTGITVGGRKKLVTGNPPKGVDAKGKPKGGRKVQQFDSTSNQNPKPESGREASHESGIQSVETQTRSVENPKGLDRKGERVNPEKKTRPAKRGKPDTTQRSPKHDKPVPAGGGAPKIKAILDLAIIKCKLLKMKTKKHDFIEENKPTRPAYRKDEDESKESKCVSCGQSKKKGDGVRNVDSEKKYSQSTGRGKEINSHHSRAGIQSGEITPHPNPVKGEHTEDTKYFSQTGEELGRGKEGRKLFEAQKLKNSDEIVEKAIELINEAYGEISKHRPTESTYTEEEKDRIEHISTGEQHSPPTPQKGEHKWVAGNDPHGNPDEYCKTCGKTRTDKEKYQGESAEDKGKRKRRHNEDIASGLRSEYHD